MANNIVVSKSSRRIYSKILQRIQRGASYVTNADGSLSSENMARTRRRVWWCTGGDPAVDSGSESTYPVAIGDFVYRDDTDEVFICSVAAEATTDATFIQLHA